MCRHNYLSRHAYITDSFDPEYFLYKLIRFESFYNSKHTTTMLYHLSLAINQQHTSHYLDI